MEKELTAQMKLCTYATIYFCGGDNSDIVIVGPRDPEEIKKRLGAGEFGFTFFDIIKGTTILDGKEINVQSEQFNLSPCYFPGGKIYSQEEMESMLKNDRDTVRVLTELASMMGTDKFCRNRLEGCMYSAEDIWIPVQDGKYALIDE